MNIGIRRFFLNLLLLAPAIEVRSLCYAEQIKDIPSEVNMSVSGVYLEDSQSTESVLGRHPKFASSEEFPKAVFLNQRRNELLTLIFHPGDEENQFAEVVVCKAKSDDKFPVLKVDSFSTEKGIKLGIAPQAIRKILGKPHKVKQDRDFTVFEYRITGDSEFLKSFNLPEYYGEYYFQSNQLTKFQFGFTYP